MALANQKGGVGKTTTAVHLAHGLALAGQKVVLLDLDPQGNASLAVQAMEDAGAEAVAEDSPFAIMRPLAPGWWILPSPGAERNLARDEQLDTEALAAMVEALAPSVDWMIVDCPPRMDQWGWAGLRLCEEVLIPVQAEFFALQGLSHMMETLATARAEFPGKAGLMGVLVTMVDLRETISRDVLGDLRANLGPHLLQPLIFRDAQLVEAASHGRTLFDYNLFSKGARSYIELVREVFHGGAKVG